MKTNAIAVYDMWLFPYFLAGYLAGGQYFSYVKNISFE